MTKSVATLPSLPQIMSTSSRRIKMMIEAILEKQGTIDALDNGSLEFHFGGTGSVKLKFSGQMELST